MEISEIIEKLHEAMNDLSWDRVEELLHELEAENEFTDPFEDYNDDEF
jgi:hypothetical protein